MTEVSQQAAQYLEDVFQATGLQLRVSVKQGVGGEVLDMEGKDAELLQAQTGELLEALQHLINQVFGRSLESGARLVCDVNGFRAIREAELQAMANFAANRVRQTGSTAGGLRDGVRQSGIESSAANSEKPVGIRVGMFVR